MSYNSESSSGTPKPVCGLIYNVKFHTLPIQFTVLNSSLNIKCFLKTIRSISLTSFQAVLLFCNYNRFYVILGSSYHRKDLAIVLDSSTSIKQDVYESSIGFIYDLVDYMSISPSTTRLALITFASKSTQKFSFEKCVNRECIHKKLLSLIKRCA